MHLNFQLLCSGISSFKLLLFPYAFAESVISPPILLFMETHQLHRAALWQKAMSMEPTACGLIQHGESWSQQPL